MADVQKALQAVTKVLVAAEERERKARGVICETLPGGLVTRPSWTVCDSLPTTLSRVYRLPRSSGDAEVHFMVEVLDNGQCVVKQTLNVEYEGGFGCTHLYILADFFDALARVAEALRPVAQALNRKEG